MAAAVSVIKLDFYKWRGTNEISIFSTLVFIFFIGQVQAEPSGGQLKADLERVLAKSYNSNEAEDSAFNSIVRNLQSQLGQTQDWEFEELAPLIGNQVSQLSRLGFYPTAPSNTSTIQDRSEISSGGLDFPDAAYPDDVTWSFGIGSDTEAEGDAEDQSEAGECSGSVRNSARTAFDLQMGAIISEGVARVADAFCEQVVVALGGGNLSIACIITEIADVVVHGILDANLLCDDIKDSVEIEASYNRLEHIHDDIDTVDSGIAEISSSISTVNGLFQDVDADLSMHDAEVKALVDQHDFEIKTLLADIQTNLENRLDVLQATSNSNGAMLLEVIRLLHTPNGQRESDITACDGGPCDWNF